MKRFSMFLVSVLVCLFASAQLTWNVKAGAGWAMLRDGDIKYQKGKLGWKIGVGVEKPLSANWLIMPSLEFKQKGTYFGSSDPSYNTVYYMYYLQSPILGSYRIRLSDEVNMTLKVGPYFAYMLSGKRKYTVQGITYEEDIFDSEFFDLGRRFDVGLLLGVDFEYHRFVLGTEFEYGLLPCLKDSLSKAYNMALYATFGYKF